MHRMTGNGAFTGEVMQQVMIFRLADSSLKFMRSMLRIIHFRNLRVHYPQFMGYLMPIYNPIINITQFAVPAL